MRQAESFHAEVDAAFKVVQTEASFKMDEETFGTEFPIRFSGDFQLPDRAGGNLQFALGLALLELDIVTIGEQAYITNPETGVWEQYPLFLTGLPDPYDLVLPPSDISRYSDLEMVKEQIIDGVQTRHIRANLRASVLGGSYEKLFVEMWIGKDDNLLRRLTMSGKAEVEEEDTAGLAAGVLDIGGEAEFTMTITYSDFNTHSHRATHSLRPATNILSILSIDVSYSGEIGLPGGVSPRPPSYITRGRKAIVVVLFQNVGRHFLLFAKPGISACTAESECPAGSTQADG